MPHTWKTCIYCKEWEIAICKKCTDCHFARACHWYHSKHKIGCTHCNQDGGYDMKPPPETVKFLCKGHKKQWKALGYCIPAVKAVGQEWTLGPIYDEATLVRTYGGTSTASTADTDDDDGTNATATRSSWSSPQQNIGMPDLASNPVVDTLVERVAALEAENNTLIERVENVEIMMNGLINFLAEQQKEDYQKVSDDVWWRGQRR